MNPTLSPDAFNAFFAGAPWVIGLLIYLTFFIAKRHEGAPAHAPSHSETFACARCGRRGARDAMVAQDHGGAVSYVCGDCATAQVAH
jgi:DNA-directed RNA polymerase subunit RPC12/RpoP